MARNSLSNFSREFPKESSCEIISKSVHRISRRSCLKLFSIYSPGGHLVTRSGIVLAILVEAGSSKKHSCIIILKSIFSFRRRSRLKVSLFLALAASLFYGGERFEQFW